MNKKEKAELEEIFNKKKDIDEWHSEIQDIYKNIADENGPTKEIGDFYNQIADLHSKIFTTEDSIEKSISS